MCCGKAIGAVCVQHGAGLASPHRGGSTHSTTACPKPGIVFMYVAKCLLWTRETFFHCALKTSFGVQRYCSFPEKCHVCDMGIGVRLPLAAAVGTVGSGLVGRRESLEATMCIYIEIQPKILFEILLCDLIKNLLYSAVCLAYCSKSSI